MKKTFIAFLFASGLVQAASVGYLGMSETQKEGVAYAWDFSQGTAAPVYGSISSGSPNFQVSDGVATIGSRGSNPWTTQLSGMGSSWTLNFDVNSIVEAGGSWKSLVTLYSNNASTQFDHSMAIGVNGTGTDVTLQVGLGGETPFAGASNASIDTGLDASQYHDTTVTLVANGEDKSLSLYIDGDLAGSLSLDIEDAGNMALTGFQFGAAFSNLDVLTEAQVSNITIWNKALESSEVYALVHGEASVPEPATVTLSLLALAALSGRRRRK